MQHHRGHLKTGVSVIGLNIIRRKLKRQKSGVYIKHGIQTQRWPKIGPWKTLKSALVELTEGQWDEWKIHRKNLDESLAASQHLWKFWEHMNSKLSHTGRELSPHKMRTHKIEPTLNLNLVITWRENHPSQ